MTYSHPAPSSSVPMPITVHRRSKSDGNLLSCLRTVEGASPSPPPPKNDQPPMPANPEEQKFAMPSSGRKQQKQQQRIPRSEVFHQWNALAKRESLPMYKIQFFTYLSKTNRSTIATWCYRVTDCFLLDRRIVGIALSYFDRYLLCNTSIRDNDCWLVVIACLHMATKLHSDKNDTDIGKAMSSLCCTCRVSIEEVAKEEKRICSALNWYLNPSMPIMYLEIVTDLIINEIAPPANAYENLVSLKARGADVVELSRYLLELSVYNLDLSRERPSSVAHAAILVAMNHLYMPTRVVNRWLSLPLEHSSSRTDKCIPMLQSILAANWKDDEVRCTSPTSPTNVAERNSV